MQRGNQAELRSGRVQDVESAVWATEVNVINRSIQFGSTNAQKRHQAAVELLLCV